MPEGIEGMSHTKDGKALNRVPVKYKVALGLPRGYQSSPGAAPLAAPQKLYHFLIESRSDSGEWEPDEQKTKELFGDPDAKPREIPIRLVGTKIEHMVKSGLFYWHTTQGRKCSNNTTDRFIKDWADRRGIPWEGEITEVDSIAQLEVLLNEGKVDKQFRQFVDEVAAELPGTGMFKKKAEVDEQYTLTPDDVLQAGVATRKLKGEYKPFPCLRYQCPDYMENRCKFNGRFFFIFENDDLFDLAHVVTTSTKNIRNLQWGIGEIIEKYAKHGLHGVRCKLVGQPERGSFNTGEGQQKTKFFIIRIAGPGSNMAESARMIREDSEEFSREFGEFNMEFDEGDEEQVANERLREFHQPALEDDGGTQITREGKFEPKDDTRSPKNYKKTVDVHKKRRKMEKNTSDESTFHNHVDELMETAFYQDADNHELVHMLGLLAEALDDLPSGNAVNRTKSALESAIIEERITLESLLQLQKNLEKMGSDIVLEDELDAYRSEQSEESEGEDAAEPTKGESAEASDTSETDNK